MKLSIIIPVYNLENYISSCLDSIYLKNPYSLEFEVVVVNDGSTDNSLAIIKDYANRFSNLKLIDKINQGVSVARNVGILESKGEYVTFVDGDDEISEGAITDILALLAKHNDVDVFYFNSKEYKSNGDFIINENKKYPYRQVIPSSVLRMNWSRCGRSIWGIVYRKNFLVGNDLYFAPNVKVCEDVIFLYELLTHDYSCMFMDMVLNIVNYRIGSASRDFSIEKVRSFRTNIDYLRNLLSCNDKYRDEVMRGYIEQAVYACISAAGALSARSSQKNVNLKKELGYGDLLPLNIKYMDPRFKTKIWLINNCNPLYLLLNKLKNS